MEDPTFTFAAFALIHDDLGRFLFKSRTDLDLWDLPGGRCEKEDFYTGSDYDRACLFREVSEELGRPGEDLIEIVDVVGLYQTDAVTSNVQSISKTYLCRLRDGVSPKTNDEAREFGWFTPDQLPDNVFRPHAVMVSDVVFWSNVIHPLGLNITRDLRGLSEAHRRA